MQHWYDARPTDAATRRRPARRTGRVTRPGRWSRCSCSSRSPRPRSPSRGSRPTSRRPTAARTPSRARRSCRRGCRRPYPGSGSLGISRSCKDGGVSEHKEGRAFDWAVNVHSARDRAYVADFMARIFATDAEGNADALARRMGIMYLIWNDHIYSSYYGFKARAYQACKVLSTCGDTLRHRNHVHISLSRAGGDGLTSWYTGATTVPTVPTRGPDRADRRRPAVPPAVVAPSCRWSRDQGRHPRPAQAEVRHRPLSPNGRGEDHAVQAAQGIALQGHRLRPLRLRQPRRRSRTRPAAGRATSEVAGRRTRATPRPGPRLAQPAGQRPRRQRLDLPRPRTSTRRP